jgi:secreted Zn-dependent insulinase-like peptidase
MADINFRFEEKSLPFSYVYSTVQALQKYPMNHVLCAESIFTEWRPDLIKHIMKYLTPQNIRIHVAAKAYENIANTTEIWYGTKYKKKKISKETINMWNNVSFNENLKLPLKNEFIPTMFDIKSHTKVIKIIIFCSINV